MTGHRKTRRPVPKRLDLDSNTTSASNPLAQQTLQRIMASMGSKPGAGMSQLIQLIHQLTSQAETLSVEALAEVVSKEPPILKKVITAANTLGYNPQGVVIDRIDQAIQVIGFERVRNLAMSLMLVDHTESKLNPAEVQESAALALASGLLTRDLIQRKGNCDPELGFVCALLRNYGRILMAQFLVDEYREARALAVEMSTDEAYIKVFGLTPVELSFHLLRANQLPKNLQEVLSKVPGYLVTTAAYSHEDDLLAQTDLAVKICDLADDPKLTQETFPERAKALIQASATDGNPLSLDELKTMLGGVQQQLTALRDAQKLSTFHSPLLNRIDALATGKPLPPVLTVPKKTPPPSPHRGTTPAASPSHAPPAPGLTPGRATLAASPSSPAGAGTPDGSGNSTRHFSGSASANANANANANPNHPPHQTSATEITSASQQRLAQGLQDLESLFQSSRVDVDRVLKTAERALTVSLHLVHCLVLLPAGDGRQFRVQVGSGTLYDDYQGMALVQRNAKDIFAVASGRCEDVLIENPNEPRIRPFIPGWLAQAAKELPIILLPVRGAQQCYALICGVSRDKRAFQLVSAAAAETKAIRSYIARLEGFRP